MYSFALRITCSSDSLQETSITKKGHSALLNMRLASGCLMPMGVPFRTSGMSIVKTW